MGNFCETNEGGQLMAVELLAGQQLTVKARAQRLARASRIQGTSLIEVLVVIVVFLIGILAVVQIFPGGFRILNQNRDLALAHALATGENEKLAGLADNLPDEILPITPSGAIDPTRPFTDIDLYNPAGATIASDGTLSYGGTAVGYVQDFIGANSFRMVRGDKFTIPAPKPYEGGFGGLAFLNFAILDPNSSLSITTDPYEVSTVASASDIPIGAVPYGTIYAAGTDSPTGALYVDASAATPTTQFVFTGTVYTSGPNPVQSYVNVVISAGSTPGVTLQSGYLVIPLTAIDPAAQSLDLNTLKIQRVFDVLTTTASFDTNNPFQYKVFGSQMGELLFNPAGYNVKIRTSNLGDVPLRAIANYVVADWRNLNTEFRYSDGQETYRLPTNGIKVLNSLYAGGKYLGVGVLAPRFDGTSAATDFLLIDETTGGVVVYDPTNPAGSPTAYTVNDQNVDPTKSSVYVDKSVGTVRFYDFDGNPANGVQVMESLPDPTQASGYQSPAPISIDGHVFKAFFQAHNEFSVFPQIAKAQFQAVAMNPGADQYVVGNATRIYVAPMYIGLRLNIGNLRYVDGAGVSHQLYNQQAIVHSVPLDPNGPYVDIRDIDPNATGFDLSLGIAVSGVKGATVGSAVYLNNGDLSLGTNSATNIQSVINFQSQWRKVILDSFTGGQAN